MSGLGTLAELAQRTGGRVVGDGGVSIARIAAVDDVDPQTLTFAVEAKYLATALGSKAAAVLVDATLVDGGAPPAAKPLLVVENARVALAALLAALEPPRPRGPFVHPSAAVEPSAVLGADVYVGPHVAIGARARLGDRVVVLAGATVMDDAEVGPDTLLYPHAYLGPRCTVGARCVLHPGAVVGSEGFGWAFLDGRLLKIPQVGTVALGDDVEIGANTCVDRAQTGVTAIGEGTKIDNLCQIGHNSRIGKHSAIAAFAGLAGSTEIGDYVLVGGQSAFKGHIRVGSRVTITGGSHVWGDVADGAFISGRPAQNHRDELRLQAYIRRLPKLSARVDALESGGGRSSEES